MKRHQRGITLIDTLGALAVGAMVLGGLVAMIDSTMEDMEGQHAARYQSQVVHAARRYISANYEGLRTQTAGGVVAPVSIGMLKAQNFLPGGFGTQNAYSHTPCVLVRQRLGDGRLDALVVSSGGEGIADRIIPSVAASAGPGNGFITLNNPTTARGSSWNLDTTPYRGVACPGGTGPVLTGTAADGGHLASNVFYDGPGQLSTDFLYRDAVPGRPELNRMRTPLHMEPGTNAVAVQDTTDTRCAAAADTGKIASDVNGRVLSCQNAVWRWVGESHWKDPKETHDALPLTGNEVGDVRMVTSLSRAFTWNGMAWAPLAVDKDGNFTVPGTAAANKVQLNEAVVKGAACDSNGMLARDGTGLVLNCQSGVWRSLLDHRITTTAYEKQFMFYSGDVPFFIDLSGFPRNNPLYLTGWAHCMSTGNGRTWVSTEIQDAVGNVLGQGGGCGVRIDTAGAPVLSKAVLPLLKLPENAARIRVYVDVGKNADDYGLLRIAIKNSE